MPAIPRASCSEAASACPREKLIGIGLSGGALAALCCATPIIAVALAAVGLSAWTARADHVLIPVLLASVGLVGIGLYRRNRSASSVAADCCKVDDSTGKLKP
ncbi:MAG: mercury resistance system transport protein MerF [Rhizobiales bacterium]|nr:mercury resistance system transport protein MerF [Hyphomicrobiales bacterium]